jgi:hypothetical protein
MSKSVGTKKRRLHDLASSTRTGNLPWRIMKRTYILREPGHGFRPQI